MKRKGLILLLTVIFTIFVSPGHTIEKNHEPKEPSRIGKKPFIISTDMGIDDCLAILYLLRHPGVDVKAVTVCGNGLAYCGPGVRNAQGLLALGWPWNIPVSCGQRETLQYNHKFPIAWRRQCSTLMGLSLPANPFPPSTLSAVDLLITTIKQSPQKVVLLALGTLTDVAEALKKEPSLKNNLEMIYIMGGAVKVGGNVEIPCLTNIKNKYAEFNIYADPVAADRVFKSGAPITLVPLDACNQVPLDMNFYKDVVQKHITPQADFVFQLLSKSLDHICSGHYFLWDPLTAVIATDNSMAVIKEMRISVITRAGHQCGRTIESPNGNRIKVCISAKEKPVKKMFQKILNGE